jgi:hypothetical protein
MPGRIGLKNLDSAYHRLIPDAICYQYGIDVLVNQMRQAAAQKQRKSVERLILALKEASAGSLDALERAQIQLECGRAAHAIEKKELAFQHIEQGIAILNPLVNSSNEHRHFRGVAMWMLGIVLNEQKPLSLKALEYFKGSLADFEILALPNQTIWPTTEWYRAAILEMRQQLNQYWEMEPEAAPADRPSSPAPAPRPPAGEAPSSNTEILRLPVAGDKPPESAPSDQPPARGGIAPAKKPGARVAWVEARLAVTRPRQLNIIGRIPAGGFGPDGQLPYRLGGIRIDGEMKDFTLLGVQCRLFSLRANLGILRLTSTRNYFILKVVGDSMNRAGIDPGDFVLVVQQDTCEAGDIVAAEINGVDDGATLKVFARQGRRISLVPKSSNPKYEEQFFDHGSNGFSIRGIILGVFKPR